LWGRPRASAGAGGRGPSPRGETAEEPELIASRVEGEIRKLRRSLRREVSVETTLQPGLDVRVIRGKDKR
jgi:hypothetical protein